MELLTISQFKDKCGCTYEAIRSRIDESIIPTTRKPITIDADKYAFLIEYYKNKKGKNK